MPSNVDHEKRGRRAYSTGLYFTGALSAADKEAIKQYCINPVEAREASLAPATSLDVPWERPADVERIEGFTTMDDAALAELRRRLGLAMSGPDLAFATLISGTKKNEILRLRKFALSTRIGPTTAVIRRL